MVLNQYANEWPRPFNCFGIRYVFIYVFIAQLLPTEWCCCNLLISHHNKTECMLLSRGHFVGPSQAIKLGGSNIDQVKFTRCLGLGLSAKLESSYY